jgi:radical SAM superfamily enzyme YgiQ (UPF0313 family)
MRVLLITSSFEDESRESEIQSNSHYPLSLAYIHAYLEQKKHEVKTLFLNDFPHEDCYQKVKETLHHFKPEVVGLNVLTNNRVSSYFLIEYIHKHHPNIRIVIGGVHTTIMHEQLLSKYPYLIAVIGEGEITLATLLEKFAKNEPINDVLGVSFYKDNKLITTPPRPLVDNLDLLPFPKHEAFLNPSRTRACLLTSRGCPFNCSFCVLDVISKRRVRFRSVISVINEIEYLMKANPNLDEVWLHDDVFLIDNNRAIDFCNEIIKRKIKLNFVCSARFKPLSQELVRKLEQAGFITVLFGLESGDPKILKAAGKQITQDDVLHAIKLFANSKIEVRTFLIVGLYGENSSSVKKTINLVKKIQRIKYIYFPDIGICAAFPGTQIYSLAKQAGIIDDSYWLTDKPTPFFTAEHSIEQLLKYKQQILNHISFNNFFTPKGFLAQVTMTPHILKFIITTNSATSSLLCLLTPLLKKAKKHAPFLYDKIRLIYHKSIKSRLAKSE